MALLIAIVVAGLFFAFALCLAGWMIGIILLVLIRIAQLLVLIAMGGVKLYEWLEREKPAPVAPMPEGSSHDKVIDLKRNEWRHVS